MATLCWEEKEAGSEGKKDFHAAKEEMLSLLAGILKKNQLEKDDVEKSDLGEEKMELDENILEVEEVPKSKLKVRKDLVTLGASALRGNAFSSKETSSGKSPELELESEEDISEVVADVADGENPNNISEIKRKFGNYLFTMLKNTPPVTKAKKPKNSFLSYFVKKAETVQETVATPGTPSAHKPEEPAKVVEVKESEAEEKEKETSSVKLPEPLDEKLINDLLDSPCKKKVSDEPDLCEVDVSIEQINEVEEVPTEETKEVEPEVEEKTVAADEPVPEKKYRRGPKSRKHKLEIKEDSSPKKLKSDPLVEAFKRAIDIKEFTTVKTNSKFVESNTAFKIWKVWYQQLDTSTHRCGECGKESTDTWDLLRHTATTCTSNFGSFLSTFHTFLTSWAEVREEVVVSVTTILRNFLVGSFCLLCHSEQANLQNHLSQIHFKKVLLGHTRMESPIHFRFVWFDFGYVFISIFIRNLV